jgi:O-antigen/teichoic acid export membrane protein
MAVVAGIILLYLLYPASRHPGFGVGTILLLSAFQIAGVLLTTLTGALFTAYGDNYLPSRYACLINVFVAVLSVLLYHSFSGPPLVKALFYLYFTFSLLQGLILYILAAQYSSKGVSSVGMRDVVRFSFSAFVTNFIFFFGARIGLYLLPHFASVNDQGNYIQAYKIVEYLCGIAAILYYPLITVVAGMNMERMAEKVLFLVRLSNTAVLFFSLVILGSGWWLFPLVFGNSFHHMYGISICLIPGLFAACSSTFFTAFFYGTGHLQYNFVSACIQVSGAFVLLFVLAPVLGATGAALAFSGAGLLSMGYDCWVLNKIFSYHIRDLFFVQKEDRRVLGQAYTSYMAAKRSLAKDRRPVQ